MAHPLMPKATAVWLIENTALTFTQIADFSGLHELEVQAIADGEVSVGMHGLSPLDNGELTKQEIERCQDDATAVLQMCKQTLPSSKKRPKGARYTPVSKRQDRPDAIAWLVKNYPELSDAQISKLVGTTKPTITAVRDRKHWNSANIKPQNPVGLGLCKGADLEKYVAIARAKAGTVHAASDSGNVAIAPDGMHPRHPVVMPGIAAPDEKPAADKEFSAESVFGPSPATEDTSDTKDS